MSTAPIALVGSGEYLPVMTAIEGALLEGRAPKYVQLATAAAPEGDDSLGRWHALGRAQAERLGVEQVVVDVRTREDADRADLAALVEGAGLVYLSGGNPAYLAETLRDSAVWHAIVAAHEAGASIAGCSAGAMALSDWAPRMRRPRAPRAADRARAGAARPGDPALRQDARLGARRPAQRPAAQARRDDAARHRRGHRARRRPARVDGAGPPVGLGARRGQARRAPPGWRLTS